MDDGDTVAASAGRRLPEDPALPRIPPEDISTARSDVAGGIGWVAFGLAVAWGAAQMDRFESMGASLYTMPGFVPALFGGALMLLGAMLAWRGWRERRAAAPGGGGRFLNARVVTMLVLSGAYAIGFVGRAPFWLGTALFVSVFAYLFAPAERSRTRRAGVAAVTGALTALTVTYVFEDVFLVRLP